MARYVLAARMTPDQYREKLKKLKAESTALWAKYSKVRKDPKKAEEVLEQLDALQVEIDKIPEKYLYEPGSRR